MSLFARLRAALSPEKAALLVLAAAAATLAGAWTFQALGFQPCELCLIERYPYYASLPLAAAAVVLARNAPRFCARDSHPAGGVFPGRRGACGLSRRGGVEILAGTDGLHRKIRRCDLDGGVPRATGACPCRALRRAGPARVWPVARGMECADLARHRLGRVFGRDGAQKGLGAALVAENRAERRLRRAGGQRLLLAFVRRPA